MNDNKKKWLCVFCGYVHEGDEPPEICPVCKAGKEAFRLLPELPEGFETEKKKAEKA